ncbi:TPA: hypothetical protein L4W84_002767 [Enterobacter kobei]|nr:hypothetical protein [Enterobacter kobei]HBO5203536.1 hypothetical protein [Enterobacter kobei]
MSYYCMFIGPSAGYEFEVIEISGSLSNQILMPIRLKDTDDEGNVTFVTTKNKVPFNIRIHDMGGIDYAYATYANVNPTSDQLDAIVAQVNLPPLPSI